MEEGIFLERVNRFTAKVKLRGEIFLSYLPNSGRLQGLLLKGRKVSLEPGRGKLPFKLTGVKIDKFWVSVDSHLVNKFFIDLKGSLKPFKEWKIMKKEYRYRDSRFDFLLTRGAKKMLVEVKSCTLVENKTALFPDAPTERGRKHLENLSKYVEEGNEASFLIVLQRPDAMKFAPNSQIDYGFAIKFYRALNSGVKAYLLVTKFIREKMELIPLNYYKLEPFDVLVNEFNYWRFPEVYIEIVKRGRSHLLRFRGTTSFACCFDENVEDFIYFARDREFNIHLDTLIHYQGYIEAKFRLK